MLGSALPLSKPVQETCELPCWSSEASGSGIEPILRKGVMRFWRTSYRYKTREIFVFAVCLFSTASILQMLSIPQNSVSGRTEPYKSLEEQFIQSRDSARLNQHEEESNYDMQVLKFQSVAEVVLPTSHPVNIVGLQKLPDAFTADNQQKRKKIVFRIEPDRITGKGGLLATREFQGNSWSGTFMKGAIVFFIQSETDHHRRRMLLRETWASIRDIDGWKLEAVFVVGRTNITHKRANLMLESSTYGDVLQYYGPDNASGATMKSLAAMQWATDNLPGDFHFASMVDDVILNLAVVRDTVATRAPPIAPPKWVVESKANDGSSVTSRQPQHVYCFEDYSVSETTERNLKFSRSVDMDTYQAMKWPPYCTEGLYVMPVALVRELYEVSRTTSLQLPAELHDVFVTGILRRKLNRGDDNVKSMTSKALGRPTLLRSEVLPRSSEKRLAHYELEAEDTGRTTWTKWYAAIRYRFHIFSNTAYT
ncbi:uncharacterized protein LOC143469159 [Clavelina lepadiformis]|uniref:uncharacterized protein LOC143469159 n=1 Tax=Clavelina lepadiformis TaxID=159417 RepID=UPI0040413B85